MEAQKPKGQGEIRNRNNPSQIENTSHSFKALMDDDIQWNYRAVRNKYHRLSLLLSV